MHSKELRIALQATSLAANLCQRVQRSLATEALEKHDKSPVTIADFGSQAIIAMMLQEAFPDIPLIAEEDASALRAPANQPLRQQVVAEVARELGRSNLEAEQILAWIDHGNASEYSELFWTLDPIDGTKGFLRGQQYAIALALLKDGEPVCATLCCPNLPSPQGDPGTTLAFDGQSTAAYAHEGGERVAQVRVSAETSLAKSRFCESVESAHSDHAQSQAIAKRLAIGGASVRMDSQAKYATVARGDAEIYLRLPSLPGYVERIWDHAAGYAIVKGAGGTITDVDGKPLDFRQGRGLDNNRGVVASNGHNHASLIEAIARTE